MLYVNAKPGILTFQAARTDLIVTPAADSKVSSYELSMQTSFFMRKILIVIGFSM